MDNIIIQCFINSLIKDIKHDLIIELEKLNIDSNDYDKTIDLLIKQKISNFEIENKYNKKYISRNLTNKNKNKCNARVWNNSYGGQCSNNKYNNRCYCKNHINMINKYGKLRFGDIDDEEPINDLINNNKLKWKYN